MTQQMSKWWRVQQKQTNNNFKAEGAKIYNCVYLKDIND